MGLGDNFYHPDGVSGLTDEHWKTHWADIYQNKPHLKNLTWYGLLGNHDYNNHGLLEEFKYNKYGWRIDDFFWSHSKTVDGETVAFVHIDTSFLAYGAKGEHANMRKWFT